VSPKQILSFLFLLLAVWENFWRPISIFRVSEQFCVFCVCFFRPLFWDVVLVLRCVPCWVIMYDVLIDSVSEMISCDSDMLCSSCILILWSTRAYYSLSLFSISILFTVASAHSYLALLTTIIGSLLSFLGLVKYTTMKHLVAYVTDYNEKV